MISFRNTYYDIKHHHDHTLKFLNSSIAFIDITNVHKRLKTKGEHSYDKFLTEWEHSYIEQLKNPKRRMDFLCGRLAGKRAVKRQLQKNANNMLPVEKDHFLFSDIEIKRTVTGRPAVFIKDNSSKNGSSDFYVSISHTEEVAASLVSNKTDVRGIGIDIEKISDRDSSLLSVAFTDREIAGLSKLITEGNGKGNSAFEEGVARYWSIKEAVMKSMGVGVNIDLKDFEVIETGVYSAEVKLIKDAQARFNLLEGTDIKVESTRIKDFMISIACLY